MTLFKKQSAHLRQQQGFALLITIIVLSVILAIGLSLMEISLKQINLTITSRESELAFVAANSGIECGQYSRFNNSASYNFDDNSFEFSCFQLGSRQISVGQSNTQGTGMRSGRVEQYNTTYDLTTPSGAMCVDITVYTIDHRSVTDSTIPPVSFSNEGVGSRDCPTGSVCTNIFSRGYNRACGDIGDRNTVQREMTAEF